MKRCSHCGIHKFLGEFGNSSRMKDGLACHCRACQAERDRRPETRFSQVRSGARKFGIHWEITLDEFRELCAMRCHYCEGPTSVTGSGLDRLDAEGPYTRANVVACCPICNHIKSRMLNPDEMLLLGPGVKVIRERRKALGLPDLISPFAVWNPMRKRDPKRKPFVSKGRKKVRSKVRAKPVAELLKLF